MLPLTRCRHGRRPYTEIVEPWTPGVATMELQPWLTTYDPDVRAHARVRAA
jgi:hypothetical protein